MKKILILTTIAILIILGLYYWDNPIDLKGRTMVTDISDYSGDAVIMGDVGIATSTPQTNLSVQGIMSLYPDGTGTTTCSSLIEGAIMYSTGTQAFYGCNGISWSLLTN